MRASNSWRVVSDEQPFAKVLMSRVVAGCDISTYPLRIDDTATGLSTGSEVGPSDDSTTYTVSVLAGNVNCMAWAH